MTTTPVADPAPRDSCDSSAMFFEDSPWPPAFPPPSREADHEDADTPARADIDKGRYVEPSGPDIDKELSKLCLVNHDKAAFTHDDALQAVRKLEAWVMDYDSEDYAVSKTILAYGGVPRLVDYLNFNKGRTDCAVEEVFGLLFYWLGEVSSRDEDSSKKKNLSECSSQYEIWSRALKATINRDQALVLLDASVHIKIATEGFNPGNESVEFLAVLCYHRDLTVEDLEARNVGEKLFEAFIGYERRWADHIPFALGTLAVLTHYLANGDSPAVKAKYAIPMCAGVVRALKELPSQDPDHPEIDTFLDFFNHFENSISDIDKVMGEAGGIGALGHLYDVSRGDDERIYSRCRYISQLIRKLIG